MITTTALPLQDYALLDDQQCEVRIVEAKKKLGKLRRATELFLEIQPEISSHTNFQMAARSLQDAVTQIGSILEQPTD